MRIPTIIFILLVSPCWAAVEEGFASLFNGEDFRGWVLVHKTRTGKGYLIEDGKIVCPKDGGGNLLTAKEYANFRFRFEFRFEPGGNNGIGIRAPISGDVAYTGMEIQVLDHDHEKYAGWLKPWQRHGAVYNIHPPHADALKPAGEWNSEEILAIGSTIRVTLNGVVITEADLSRVTDPETIKKHPGMLRKTGRVGFLGHGSFAEFRNIRIQELPNLDNPQVCELALEETCDVWLADGTTKQVKLDGFSERREPFFETAENRFVEAVAAAEAQIRVDRVRGHVPGGPYRLPTEVNGLQVLVSNTAGWQGGIHQDEMADGKLVRLELQDASLPFYPEDRFVFPIENYRWRAENFLDTFLGIVVDQERLYYHRGEDYGNLSDSDAVVSMTDGTIAVHPGPRGDNESNYVIVEDSGGLSLRYAHMNAPYLRPGLKAGSEVRQGEALGRTGNTWQGKPASDPHLHVDATIGEKLRNSYPMFMAAYRRTYPDEILPVAGGVRYTWAGDEVELDGSLTIPPPGRHIVDYRWTFSDDSSAEGAKVTRKYDRAGVYTETLRVIDDKGETAYDFAEVYVLDKSIKKRPPYVRFNYHPVRGIRPGAPVSFDIRAARLSGVKVDFGDGTVREWQRTFTHAYERQGTYFVTVRGKDAGSGPGVFRAKVVVEE